MYRKCASERSVQNQRKLENALPELMAVLTGDLTKDPPAMHGP